MDNQIKEAIERARQIAEWMQSSENKKDEALEKWLSSDKKHRKLFEKLQRKDQFYPYFLWRNSFNIKLAWNDLQHRRHRVMHKRNLLRWVSGIAASLLLIFGGYKVYTLWHQEQQLKETVQIQPFHGETVQPGKTQAYLQSGENTFLLTENMEVKAGGLVTERNTGDTLFASAEKIQKQSIVVPRGSEYHLTLNDGTRVWLNADSKLSYPTHFPAGRREVELEGEAYFEVAHNTKSPFYVHIGGRCVHVTGTTFNIRHYIDEQNAQVSLLQGGIQMETNSGKLLCTLLPGQQFDILRHTGDFHVKTFDVQEVLAWKNGLFVFNNIPLSAIAIQLERWYDVKIDVAPSLANNRYMGTLNRRQDMTAIVHILESTGELRFVSNTEGHIFIKPVK